MNRLYNPYIIIPLVTWAVAQLLKFSIKAARGDVNWRNLYASGGMPSVHSAAICALAVTALAYDGYNSAAFGICAVLTAVVMYDSFGVRRSVGDQAVALNAILENTRNQPNVDKLKLREVLGHRPSEVISGAVLGVVLATLMTINRWDSKVELVTDAPYSWERALYLAVFIIGILVAFVINSILGKRRIKQTKSIKTARHFGLYSLLGICTLGLLIALMQYQQIKTGEWRLWSLLLLGTATAGYCLAWYYWLRFVPRRHRQELASKKRH